MDEVLPVALGLANSLPQLMGAGVHSHSHFQVFYSENSRARPRGLEGTSHLPHSATPTGSSMTPGTRVTGYADTYPHHFACPEAS